MRQTFHGKVIHDRESPAGWAVVVMPDYILIDNYHGEPHIHTNPRVRARDRKVSIRTMDREEALRILLAHIEANRGINRRKLLRKLGAEL